MKFTNTLLKGKLIRRYKRFFTDIEVNNKTEIAHCPNTGSMMGLLDQGNEAWISKHNDPKRKLKFTLEMIKVKKKIIGVSCHNSITLVKKATKDGADYVALGSFFKSKTKQNAIRSKIQIINKSKKVSKLPIVCIGGITDKNYKKLILHKPNFLAISSYIWSNSKLKPQEAAKKIDI